MSSNTTTLLNAGQVTTDPLRRLRRVLNANAVFSLTGGVAALAAAPWISDEFGVDHVALTRAIGAGLVLFALFVAWVARQPEDVVRRETLAISAGDATWVLASIVVVASDILTTSGVVVTLLIAMAVGDFGIMQFLLRRSSRNDSSLATR